MKVHEETVVYVIIIATRENSLNAKENQIMKVIYTYVHGCCEEVKKKDEIIIGHLPQKILSLQNNCHFSHFK